MPEAQHITDSPTNYQASYSMDMRVGFMTLLLALLCVHGSMCEIADESRAFDPSFDADVPRQRNAGLAVLETEDELQLDPDSVVDEAVQAETTDNGTDNAWAESSWSEEVETNNCTWATSAKDCHHALSSCSWKPITKSCVSAMAGGKDDNRDVFRHGAGLSLKPSDYSVQPCSDKCAIIARGESIPEAVQLMKTKGWHYATLKKLILDQCDCKDY